MTGTQAAGGFAKEPKAERKGTHIIASYTLLVENNALTSYEDHACGPEIAVNALKKEPTTAAARCCNRTLVLSDTAKKKNTILLFYIFKTALGGSVGGQVP